MSAPVVLPFHQDQLLGGDSIAVPDTTPAIRVEPDLPGGDQWQRLVSLYDELAEQVASQVQASTTATVLSGDCLAALGSLAGAQRSGVDPSVVWFDAHGDVHTLASSTSGYLGGMALRMVMGGDPDRLATPLGLRPVAEGSVVLVDARDLDPAEIGYLTGSRVRRGTVDELDAAAVPDGPLLVHIDLDVIDPAELPGLRFPAPGGPSRVAVLAALQRLVRTGRVIVLDVACPWFEPTDDAQQRIRQALLADVLEILPVAEGA